jgi:hypothetical protein
MNFALIAAATVGALLSSTAALADEAEPSDPARTDAPLPAPPPPPVGAVPDSVAASPKRVRRHDAPPAVIPKRTRWYGWQTLLADGASVAMFVGGAGAESGELALAGLGGLLLAAPIVHFSHRNVGRGFLSLGARVAFPITGAAIGAAAEDCSRSSGELQVCTRVGMLLGGLVGVVTAVIVDASVLAHEPDPEPADGVRLTPGVALGSRSQSLILNGRF